MAFIIEDGTGAGYRAKVNDKNQLYVLSQSRSIQHFTSHEEGRAYQLLSSTTISGAGKSNILLIKNISQIYDIVITYIRLQAIGLAGGTAIPSVNSYFSIYKNPIYNSGGESVVPINVNFSSAFLSECLCYKNGFSVSDDGEEIDRWFVEDASKMHTFNKEGSVIIGQNDSIGISLNTDHTSGIAYSRISFLEITKE